ncbi:hypothetical protein MTO96_003774 [Rhipicephalus appendiculatus]
MSAPSAAIHGRGMWLNCSFDLESDELYSVKWYKNDTEFYRYIPRDRPPAQNYDLPGVVVDMARSREGHVFISSVNLSTEGNYRCEASAEAPSFQTVVQEKEVKVFVIPEHPPTIRGTRAKYGVGERVDVSCRAPYSLPAAKLVWLVNDQEVPFTDVRELETLYDSEGLQSSGAVLSFTLRPHHMAGSWLRLKCVSVISEVYLTSSEELIAGNTEPSIPYPEKSPDSPVIEGGKQKYLINDLVNLTCRSAEYDTPPELTWFINDKEVAESNTQPTTAAPCVEGSKKGAVFVSRFEEPPPLLGSAFAAVQSKPACAGDTATCQASRRLAERWCDGERLGRLQRAEAEDDAVQSVFHLR